MKTENATLITKRMWDAANAAEKKIHKDKSKWMLLKGASGQGNRWVQVYWKS